MAKSKTVPLDITIPKDFQQVLPKTPQMVKRYNRLFGEGRETYFADYGQNTWHVAKFDKDCNIIWHNCFKTEEFIGLQWLPKGSSLVGEKAHLYCPNQEKISLAQPLTLRLAKTLEANALLRDCDIWVVSESQTPKARNAFFNSKAKLKDIDDLTAIHFTLRNTNTTINSLKRFEAKGYEKYKEKSAPIHQTKEEMNSILNKARASDYKIPSSDSDFYEKFDFNFMKFCEEKVLPAIKEKFPLFVEGKNRYHKSSFFKTGEFKAISSPVPMETRILGFYDWEPSKNEWKPSKKEQQRILCTFLSCFIDENGQPRLHISGDGSTRINHVNFVMNKLLGFTPNHLKGGVARSNVFYHNLRSVYNSHVAGLKKEHKYTLTKGGRDIFSEERRSFMKDYRRATKDILRAIRKVVAEEFPQYA